MQFVEPLIEGVLLKRYKRFLADVELDTGEIIIAHVPNSGSMFGVSEPGSLCRISRSPNLGRKLPYTLEMVRTQEGEWVGTNTSLTNALVQEAFEKKIIPEWKIFESFKREVKISKESRLDFLLTGAYEQCYVEVKNVSMARPPCAVFPDAKTERGQKHLRDLARLSQEGFKTEIFFVVQRQDCHSFSPCDDIDPVYGKILREVSKDVSIRSYSCELTPNSITIARPLEVNL